MRKLSTKQKAIIIAVLIVAGVVTSTLRDQDILGVLLGTFIGICFAALIGTVTGVLIGRYNREGKR